MTVTDKALANYMARKKLVEILTTLRKERGINQNEIAKMLNVSGAAICDWEHNGKTNDFRIPVLYCILFANEESEKEEIKELLTKEFIE